MKKKKIGKALTWEELANIYDKATGGKARTKPMDVIFNWAENQPKKFKVDKEGSIHLILKKKKK